MCGIVFGQGPEPCPCDPTEGEEAFLECLESHPECNEDIPIDTYVHLLALGGIGYATYRFRLSNKHKNI
ncbi:MAG TPA: hypothetical protein VL947_14285 [Cytophagales bacterium]|nr:hypothetical protein [Cytophagales bacterium]